MQSHVHGKVIHMDEYLLLAYTWQYAYIEVFR